MVNKNLYRHLLEYNQSGIYPMHMPGHKRNSEFFMENPYIIDVTEVEGTDNLHHPEGVIKDLIGQMRSMYQTKHTYPLVGGSTCGILTAISACCRRGDKILMSRNCHRSVYHAVYLLELTPVYLYPEKDAESGIALGIPVQEVEQALLQHPNASCAIITSPTYEGVLSDVKAIAKSLHGRRIPLIVDAAHGAHLYWSKDGKRPATECGADLVIESLHKTLPCFTQTGVLHRCSDRVSTELLERYLAIYETSSPSYILMAGIAQCMEWLEKNGNEAFEKYNEQRRIFDEKAKNWKVLTLWENPNQESSKLVILTGKKGKTGQQLAELLRKKYQIEVEMSALTYVLAMTSVADSCEGWQRFLTALTEIDEQWQKEQGEPISLLNQGMDSRAKAETGIYEAMNTPWKEVLLEDSVGRISAEYAFIYPPGIPFLVPGERIEPDTLSQIKTAMENKLELLGLADETAKTIRVCQEKGK